MACAARLAAPRADAAFPPRSLAAAITTGADSGVLDHGGQRISPRTSSDFPPIFVCPNLAPVLLMPVDPFLHRVDVNERQGARARQQRRPPGQRDQEPRPAFSSWLTFPQV